MPVSSWTISGCGDVALEVYVEDGFVSDIVGEITFVNDADTERLLELLESMGWLPADDDGGLE